MTSRREMATSERDLTDEQLAARRRRRPQRMAFADALVEWIRVGASEDEIIDEARGIYRRHSPNGGRPRA
ncbi:MAG: hypothetical protein QOJ29_3676 [Thermoleophilaceae bacterium]|nr:hypothetical protein [Thermoleophilaceae bacterium]